MIVGAPGRDAFKTGVWGYTKDKAVTFDAGVCISRSAVRKRTVGSDVIGKEWVQALNLRKHQHLQDIGRP